MKIQSNANLQRINNHKLLFNPQIKEQNCIANFYNIESDKFEQNNTSKAITSFTIHARISYNKKFIEC